MPKNERSCQLKGKENGKVQLEKEAGRNAPPKFTGTTHN